MKKKERKMKNLLFFALLSFCLISEAGIPVEKCCETRYSEIISTPKFYPGSGANGFYAPGQSIPLILSLKNNTSRQIDGKLYCTVRNFRDKIISVIPTENFTLKPNSMIERKIMVSPPAEKGYFIANARIDAEEKTVLETQSAFAVAEPITGRRDPFFTIDNNLLTDKLIDGFKAMGIGNVCIGDHELLFYNNYYKKSVNMKEAVAKSLQEGLWKSFLESDFELCGKVGYDNFWPLYYERRKQGLPLMNDEIVILCSQYAEELARQTKGRIHLFKSNNEIDAHVRCRNMAVFGSGAEILGNSVTLVRTLYQGLKRGNPEAEMAVLGIYGGDYYYYPEDRRFPISRMFLDGLGENFDLICIDAYNGNWNGMIAPLPLPEHGLRDYLLAAADLSASYKRPKTVLNTERGYQQGYNDAFDSALSKQIALYFARSIIINRSTPSPMFTIHYCADNPLVPWRRNKPLDNSKRTPDMGIWKTLPDYEKNENFYVPRPAASAIAVAARELAFVKPVREIIRNGTIYCYIFEKQDETAVAALYTIGTDTDFAFIPAVPMTVTDLMGNKENLPAGKNILRLSRAPFYLSGKLSAAELGKMMEDGKLTNLPPLSGEGRIADQNTIRLYVRNNENQAHHGKILLDGSFFPVMLPAEQVRNIDLTWKQGPISEVSLHLENGQKFVIPVNTEFIKVPFLAKKPLLNGSGFWLAERPVGRLKTPDDIWPKSELIPEAGNFKLDGTDIYADYWLGYDRENLYFAVKVKDQIHLQRQTGVHLWMEDMVQFVLTARDLPPKSVREKSSVATFGNEEYCYALALSPKGEELQCWSGGRRTPGERDFPHSIKRMGDITFYEVAIPWKESGIVPKKGSGIRFSFIVQDNNRISNKAGRYHLALTGGIYGTENQDSSLFKTLLLE